MTVYVFPGCPEQLAHRAPLNAPAAGAEPVFQAPAAGVAVRMYRQGLGDCFLLAFPTGDPGQSYYVLIDCGVITGAPNGSANLNAVAQDIKLATGGQIDLLVITHRHADHTSGFQYANSVFASLQIHNLWLSWLENPGDAFAAGFWKRSGQATEALTNAVRAQPAAMTQVATVLDFIGDLGAAPGGDPLGFVRQVYKRGPDAITYCCPGDGPLALPAADGRAPATGARLFVLGPPTDPARLAQMDPTGNPNEIYIVRGQGLNAITAFLMGVIDADDLPDDDCELHEKSYPFAPNLRLSYEEARDSDDDFFRTYYGFDGATGSTPGAAASSTPGAAAGGRTARARAVLPPPLPANAAWRRIDDDWLSSSEELALQLDNCINNSSLVLAIEMVKSHKVLLFAADAQVGNWLSWASLPGWTISQENRTVTVPDLLARTVFYKVGHHGSHNATGRQLPDARPWGLELMTNPELVAMLPVDEQTANCSKHWQMPWPDLMDHLIPRTGGRIMRLDNGIPPANPGLLNQADWDTFAAEVQTSGLYVQYTLAE